MNVPTAEPLTEDVAHRYFRDMVLGIEYCKYCISQCAPYNTQLVLFSILTFTFICMAF